VLPTRGSSDEEHVSYSPEQGRLLHESVVLFKKGANLTNVLSALERGKPYFVAGNQVNRIS